MHEKPAAKEDQDRDCNEKAEYIPAARDDLVKEPQEGQ